MHEEGGELHHVAPAAAGGLERLLDLRIDRRALRFEGLAGRDHAGDVQRLAALDARDVRVGPDRLAERFHVAGPDLCHGFTPSFSAGRGRRSAP